MARPEYLYVHVWQCTRHFDTKLASSVLRGPTSVVMASGVIRGALSMFIEDENLIPSDVNTRAKGFAATFLSKAMETGDSMDVFDEFCSRLEGDLEGIFHTLSKRVHATSALRTHLWSAFHVRRKEMEKLWVEKFKLESDGPHVNFFAQSVNQAVFEEKLKSYMAKECPLPVECDPKDQPPELTKDELNSMQYACGYVPHQLLKKYEKRIGTKYSVC